MRDQMKFDVLLDDVLRGVANPEPMGGLQQRMMDRVEASKSLVMGGAVAGRLEGDGAAAIFGIEKDQGVLGSLWSGLREVIFPMKLPPLVLQSRPLAVADRMAGESNYPSAAYAVAVHALAILLIGFVVNAQIRRALPAHEEVTEMTDPPSLRVEPKADRVGGGGGQSGDTPVSRGRLPKFAEEQLVPPTAVPLLPPKIAIEPSVAVQKDLKMAENTLPNIGLPNSPLVSMSPGSGRGTGVGSGDGDGIGPGLGGNMGLGPRQVGGGVSAPVVLFQPEPEFSEQARKAKASGNVEVYLWVDERGNPTHVRVVRGVGLGLDEKAVEAVRQYRFKPAMENGRPVTVEMYVEVVFQIL